eukprot:CAMPEP_0197044594 /NCGR_PEP_ID=MMETSP1384-20130603/20620_1 /TAXON_ID=29189 /ORGANISM="Ammonia sp." /LENGTH=66 /DNA_ID=CAMNT_0042476079 /DNA_START=110 /DNA_END=307 /DNA_ORIENTATION=+
MSKTRPLSSQLMLQDYLNHLVDLCHRHSVGSDLRQQHRPNRRELHGDGSGAQRIALHLQLDLVDAH